MRRLILPALTVLAIVACTQTSKYIRPTTDVKAPTSEAAVARGRYLVDTIGACGACHTAREDGSFANPEDESLHLAGGNWLQDGKVGVWVPNITPDEETGLGRWSDDEIARAIRDGVHRSGRFLVPLMPSNAYQHLSDEDTFAIVAYLRTVPPKKPVTERRAPQLPFPMGMVLESGAMQHPPATDVPPPDRNDPVAYGRYLAFAGHCTDCHSMGARGPRPESDRFLAGAETPMDLPGIGKVWAPNLTPDEETGLGRYTPEQIRQAIRSGMRLDGKLMAPPMSMLVPHYALMEESDLDALVTFLRSLPPVRFEVPARQLTPEAAQMFGG